MAAGPRYVGSARIKQKTQLVNRVTATEPLPSNGRVCINGWLSADVPVGL
jgi:hypothetical protein